MNKYSTSTILFLSVTLSAGLVLLNPSLAQTQKKPPVQTPITTQPTKPAAAGAPAPAAGQQISKEETSKFDNWIVKCRFDEAGKKLGCVATLVVADQKTNRPIFELQIRKPVGGTPSGTISVSSGAFLQPGITLTTDTGLSIEAKFVVCRPNLCVAEFAVDDNFIKTASAAKNMGLSFVRGDQQTINSQFSPSGIDKALNQIR